MTETKGTSTTAYTYDFNGNLLERDDGADEEIYGYDVKNRQRNYSKLVDSIETKNNIYSYRPDGLRSSSISCTSYNEISFIWDGMNLVHEYYMDTYNWGDVENIYIYGINLIKSYMGCLIDSKQSATKYYYFYNAHGDVTGLVGSSGSIVKYYTYDAFGNEKNPSGSDMNPFRYCGEYWDKDTETYYLRARYYDPKLGRFLTVDTYWNVSNMLYGDDPIQLNGKDVPNRTAYTQSLNLYSYCGNNPIMWVDPLGQAWWHWALGAVIVVAAAIATVVTAGGATAAIMAVASVAGGTAVATTGATIAAGAFISASMVYGGMVIDAAMKSNSIKEFNDQGSWGVVFWTAGAAGLGGLHGYLATRGTENKNIFTGKTYTNKTSTGVSNFESDTKGMDAATADFNALNPTNVKTYSNGTTVGYLPDGRTVNMHTGSSTGGPTLEIYDPSTGEKIKIRY